MDIILIDKLKEIDECISKTIKDMQKNIVGYVKDIFKNYNDTIKKLNIKKQITKINKIYMKEFNSKNKIMYQSIIKYNINSLKNKRQIYLLRLY